MTSEGFKWTDLSTGDPSPLRDFYAEVVGWSVEYVDMGGYSDYVMKDEHGAVAGICHARGINEGLPPVWLPYFRVQDLQHSLSACKNRGGRVTLNPTPCGKGMRYGVIQDPCGAYAALIEESDKP